MAWYKDSVFYQIYPRTFNKNLKGISKKLDYIKDLGIDAIWLSPFYPHSNADGGYDVKDYLDVANEFGDLEDFKELINQAHDKGIKVIIDLVINHTSTEHPWFIQSQSKRSDYDDYYIWMEEPPSNWESFFKGSAWKYCERRKKFFYSSFSDKQADLNWTNPKLIEEFRQIMFHWIELGVDGFRLDVINNLTVDLNFKDNPYINNEQLHLYDVNQNGIKNVLRSLLEDMPKDVVFVAEISSNNPYIINDYVGSDLFDLAFSFNLLDVNKITAENLAVEMKRLLESLATEKLLPTLVFSSHDAGRIFNRLAECDIRLARLIGFFLLTAQGVPFIFQGEELGMSNKNIKSLNDILDVQGLNHYEDVLKKTGNEILALESARLHTRDYSRNQVVFEKNDMFKFYKEMIELRKRLYFNTYDYDFINSTESILTYKRGSYIFVLNISKEIQYIESYGKLIYSSLNNMETSYEIFECKIWEV